MLTLSRDFRGFCRVFGLVLNLTTSFWGPKFPEILELNRPTSSFWEMIIYTTHPLPFVVALLPMNILKAKAKGSLPSLDL